MERKIKYRYNRLKGLIKEHYGTQAAFAEQLGLSTTTLTSRLSGDTYFDQVEIDKALKLLGVKTLAEKDSIFFDCH